MQKYNDPIPMPDAYKRRVVDCINDGDFRYKMCLIDYHTDTHNGSGHTLWNFINTQVIDTLPNSDYTVLQTNKNSWEFVAIFEKSSSFLYLLTRDETLKALKGHHDEKVMHYFNAFSVLNARLLAGYEVEPYQYNMFDEYSMFEDPEIVNMLGNDLSKMLRNLNEDVKRFVLVCFSQKDSKVNKIYAEVPVYGFRTVYQEPWTYVLDADYDVSLDIGSVVSSGVESEIELTLYDDDERIIYINDKDEILEDPSLEEVDNTDESGETEKNEVTK